jgi:predicted acyltransferase
MTNATDSSQAPTPIVPAPTPSQRLMSLDALRGFDMFWIIGADALVRGLRGLGDTGFTGFLATQLEHVEWEGFRFYDLIFPLFVFMAGVSLVFSLTRTLERAGRAAALKRVFRRGLLLFVLGIIFSGGVRSAWPDIRLMGVLQRIALAYFFAGLLFCYLKPRALLAVAAGLLLGYWALLALVPIRNIQLEKSNLARLAEQAGDSQAAALLKEAGNPSAVKDSPAWAAARKMFQATTHRVTGKFEKGLNLSNHLDFQFLPGRKYDNFWDPEGLLSTMPAVVTCLLGVFAGLLVRSASVPDLRKVLLLLAVGAAGVALGWLWNLQFPVIKKIWTSSYVLVAGGYSAMLLGAFYLVVEVWKFQKWCRPFVWVGMNSITVYLASNFLGGFRSLAQRLVGGDVQGYFNKHWIAGLGDLLVPIVGLFLMFWFVNFLYRKKVFLRL